MCIPRFIWPVESPVSAELPGVEAIRIHWLIYILEAQHLFGSQLPEPPDSWHHCRPTLLSWNSSPALHHIPSLWFSSYFSHYYSTVLFMAKLPSPICPGGVCLDSPTSFVLSLFTAPGEVTFSQDGLHKLWGLLQNESSGSFSKQWLYISGWYR